MSRIWDIDFELLFKRGTKFTALTRCPIEMGFRSECNIFDRLVIYIEKSKLNITNTSDREWILKWAGEY